VSLSSQIIREYKEFERTHVTVLDAYIKPLVLEYLEYLESFLQQQGFRGDFMIQRSGGGVLPAAFVSERPVETLFSGPAGGVMGALHIAKSTPYKNLVLGDVGGTSFDVSLISNGQEQVMTEASIGHMPIMIPMLDIRSIGAGGGSMGWLDKAGAIHVGPQSAGADPGPVCYDRGGVEPTVTDAAVYNKYISAENFLGGRIRLRVDKAEEAIRCKIADPLGMSVARAADGILQIVSNNMVDLIREIMTEKGEDLRKYSLLMFGGAGPLFGTFILDRLDIGRMIIPRDPANFSAYGMLVTDIVYDYTQTFVRLLDEVGMGEMEKIFLEMERRGLEKLNKAGIPEERRKVLRSIDVRYLGLTHALNVRVLQLSEATKPDITNEFHALYEKIYGYRLENPLQVVRLNVKVIGILEKPPLSKAKARKSGFDKVIKGKREVFLSEGSTLCYVYEREKLGRDDKIDGPAIVEEPSSTAFIGKGQELRVDEWGNLIIERKRGSD
jgi:N-methylhydantoinase A